MKEECAEGKTWFFLCGRWLAKNEDDGQVERDLAVQNEDGVASLPSKHYHVTTVTGDRRGAGTDANVFIELKGANGTSGRRKLEGHGNCFERAQRDEFTLECVDLGELASVLIGHDNFGIGAAWFLDKVRVHGVLYCALVAVVW